MSIRAPNVPGTASAMPPTVALMNTTFTAVGGLPGTGVTVRKGKINYERKAERTA